MKIQKTFAPKKLDDCEFCRTGIWRCVACKKQFKEGEEMICGGGEHTCKPCFIGDKVFV